MRICPMAFVFWIPNHLPRLHAFYFSSTSSESLRANRTHELLLTKRTCVSPNSWSLEPQVYLSRMTNFSLRLWKHETCFGDIPPLLKYRCFKKNSTSWHHVVGDSATHQEHRRISSPTVGLKNTASFLKHFSAQASHTTFLLPHHPNQAKNISRFNSNYLLST